MLVSVRCPLRIRYFHLTGNVPMGYDEKRYWYRLDIDEYTGEINHGPVKSNNQWTTDMLANFETSTDAAERTHDPFAVLVFVLGMCLNPVSHMTHHIILPGNVLPLQQTVQL